MPEMGLVTVFSPLTMTGSGELVIQKADETRFVVDCRVKPVVLVGHVKMTLDPERIKVRSGGPGTVRLKTVPSPLVPPRYAVPHRVLPEIINPVSGLAPSLLVSLGENTAVKLCRFVKPFPLLLTANTVPLPEPPPYLVVP